MRHFLAACFLGVALGVALGLLLGTLGEALESFDPHEPVTLLSSAATRLREFQSRVSDLRVSDLVDTLTSAYCKQIPKG